MFESLKNLKNMKSNLSKMQSVIQSIHCIKENQNKSISIKIDGQFRIQDLQIKPEAMDLSPKELADSIKNTYNQAAQQVQGEIQSKTQALMSGAL